MLLNGEKFGAYPLSDKNSKPRSIPLEKNMEKVLFNDIDDIAHMIIIAKNHPIIKEWFVDRRAWLTRIKNSHFTLQNIAIKRKPA
jgi:hypothetical protein